MMRRDPGFVGEFPGVALGIRLEVFERISRRREDIRLRWERLGISVDAAELVREVREEER